MNYVLDLNPYKGRLPNADILENSILSYGPFDEAFQGELV